MKALLLSDIHGSLPALERALDFYNTHHCDLLCLLGDVLNYGPRNSIPEGIDAKGVADRLNAMADNIVAVRGNCDSEVDQMLLRFPIMDTQMLIVDGARRLLLTHGHVVSEDALPAMKIDVLVHGHSHLWELTQRDDFLLVNTGSPTFPKGGRAATFGLYDNGRVSIHQLDGQELAAQTCY